jgi:NAD(P)-dependent dehydrogenase (short-subunit alcohol dehydrogenase family)
VLVALTSCAGVPSHTALDVPSHTAPGVPSHKVLGVSLDPRLDGRAALVTGGGGGIGSACARALGEAGAAVLIVDVDVDAARRVAGALTGDGIRAEAHAADVTDPDAVAEMVELCQAEFGSIDIAVNNAGIHGDPASPPLADFELEWWERTLAINLSAVFYCLRAELRAMRAQGRGGSIVNMGSIYSQVAHPGVSAYVASKHGVVGLTKAAAVDHAADGIRVNAVGPGFIDAGLVHRHIPEAARPEFAALHPLGRLGLAEEVAAMVTFLAGDAAGFCTGNYYPVEGGLLAR